MARRLRSFEFIPPQASRQAAHADSNVIVRQRAKYSSRAAMAAPSAAILKRYQKNARTFFEPTRRREAPQEPRKLGHGNPGGKSGSRPLLAGNITKYSHFK
jgi:hypothetical protein